MSDLDLYFPFLMAPCRAQGQLYFCLLPIFHVILSLPVSLFGCSSQRSGYVSDSLELMQYEGMDI